MNVLFYRYGSICEPDIKTAFTNLGVNVTEITEEITNKSVTPNRQVELIDEEIKKARPLFVFTINYFPAIAEICHIYGVLYLCWTVDCPVLELFSSTIKYDTNRIFLFDYAQYEYYAPYNPDCIFYLPLAAAVDRFDATLRGSATQQSKLYNYDISFVGSLYSEKNPLNRIKDLPDYVKGYIDGIAEASLLIYGSNFIESSLDTDIVNTIKQLDKNFYVPIQTICDSDRFVTAHSYMGYHIAEVERVRTLNTLASHFSVDLHTRSDISALNNVHTHGGVSTLTEMPFVFNQSKINLNMTIKPIQTGLPLRIFDIMGCGGFVMTNYQAEIPEYFDIGTDIEAYASMDELIDKCDYYLKNDDIRKKIALNGYEKVKTYHTYTNRINEMLKKVLGE